MALPLDVLLHIKCQTSHGLEKGLIELTRLSKSDRFFRVFSNYLLKNGNIFVYTHLLSNGVSHDYKGSIRRLILSSTFATDTYLQNLI